MTTMATTRKQPGRGAKAPLSVNVDALLLDKLRDAAVHLGETLAALTEEALRRELRRIERAEGKIPPRKRPPRTGRPIGRE